jgi:hypothetical protein
MNVKCETESTGIASVDYAALPELHIERHERALIIEALRRVGKEPEAADLLGVSRWALGRAMKKYGITVEKVRREPRAPKAPKPEREPATAEGIRLPPKRQRRKKSQEPAGPVGEAPSEMAGIGLPEMPSEAGESAAT